MGLFNNFASAPDYETDTKFIDNYGQTIKEVIANITPIDGGSKFVTTSSNRTYSNFLDAVRDEAGQQGYELSKGALAALEVNYDANNDSTTKWFHAKYKNNPELGKQKYIESVFKYRYPMEYNSSTQQNIIPGTSTGGRSTTTTESNPAAIYLDVVSADATYLGEAAGMSSTLVAEIQKQARQDGKKTNIEDNWRLASTQSYISPDQIN